MAEPSFTKPSQGHLIAFDFLMKAEEPFTRIDFLGGCNELSQVELKPATAASYLRGFRKAGILKETSQYPHNVWELAEGWESNEASERLKAAYYYS